MSVLCADWFRLKISLTFRRGRFIKASACSHLINSLVLGLIEALMDSSYNIRLSVLSSFQLFSFSACLTRLWFNMTFLNLLMFSTENIFPLFVCLFTQTNFMIAQHRFLLFLCYRASTTATRRERKISGKNNTRTSKTIAGTTSTTKRLPRHFSFKKDSRHTKWGERKSDEIVLCLLFPPPNLLNSTNKRIKNFFLVLKHIVLWSETRNTRKEWG